MKIYKLPIGSHVVPNMHKFNVKDFPGIISTTRNWYIAEKTIVQVAMGTYVALSDPYYQGFYLKRTDLIFEEMLFFYEFSDG